MSRGDGSSHTHQAMEDFETMASEQTEKQMAVALGIPLRSLREIRKKMLAEKDWRREGRAVVLNPAGIKKLEEMLELKKKAGEPANEDAVKPQRKGEGKGLGLEGEELTGRVAKIWHSKARVLGVEIAGELLKVRVRTCEKFLLGMEIPIRKIGPDMWELARALPRWRGKW